MDWDKFRMAQKFLQQANAIHPEDLDGRERVDSLARQDVYYDCYMSSFSREDLLKRLGDVITGKFEKPEEDNIDEQRYREIYVKEAQVILASLERGELKG